MYTVLKVSKKFTK